MRKEVIVMNKEEFLKAIMELPKAETINPISTMNSININDLMSAVDRLNKVPDYNGLLKENKQLQDLIDTILNFSFFKEECPLNFVFEDNSKEDEAQNIFYSDEYCENNCNGIYKDCWLKYFKELQELEQGSYEED